MQYILTQQEYDTLKVASTAHDYLVDVIDILNKIQTVAKVSPEKRATLHFWFTTELTMFIQSGDPAIIQKWMDMFEMTDDNWLILKQAN